MKKFLILYSLLIVCITASLLPGCNTPKNKAPVEKPLAQKSPSIETSSVANTDNNSLKDTSTNTSKDKEKNNPDLPSPETLKLTFHNLINDFLAWENDYIYIEEKTVDSLLPLLSSNSPLRDTYKNLKAEKKITEKRLFEQLGSCYDQIDKIKVLSHTTAKVQSLRYVEFSQTPAQAYTLRKLTYDLVFENNKWLIKSIAELPFNYKPITLNPTNPTVDEKTLLNSINTYNKTNHSDTKIKKLITTIQYPDRILVTTLSYRTSKDTFIATYFISPLTTKVAFSNVANYSPDNNDVLSLNSDEFKDIYDKATTLIILSEEPILFDKSKVLNKTPLIASIIKCNEEYIIPYYNQYNSPSDGSFTCHFYTAILNKANNKLVLKFNRYSFND